MPTIVKLTTATPRARKRPGRTPESVAAWLAGADTTYRTTTASLRDRPHLSYNPDNPNRIEHARHLNMRARTIIGVEDFHAGGII